VKKFCDVAGVGAHAEEHGYGFVDGGGRKLGEPGIANAPGGESGDGERKRGWEFAANVLEESGVKGLGAGGGIKVDLDGRDAGDGLRAGDLRGEESALRVGIGEGMQGRLVLLERRKPRRGRDFHADDGDERRACRDAQRLETRANDERRGRVGGICGRRLEINCFGEEGDASLIRSQKA